MRFAIFFATLVSGAGLSGCRNRAPTFEDQLRESQKARPAPVIGPGTVNPPLIETPRTRTDAHDLVVRTIAKGTTIQVRNSEPISLGTARPGETFPAVVARNVVDENGRVAIPRGSVATLILLRAGIVDIGGVVVAGRRYGLEGSRRGDPSTRAGQIPASSLLSFRLDDTTRIREIR